MKLFLFLFVMIITFPVFAADTKESAYDRVMRTGTLRCGYGIWPPFFEVDVNTGALKGMVKDMSDGIADILDLKIEYVPVVIGPSAAQDLEAGKVDAICGDGAWMLSSMKKLNYTTSYLYAGIRLYGRQDDMRFSTKDGLNNPDFTFVGIDSDLTTDLVLRTYPKAKLRTLAGNSDPSQMFMDIIGKKADLMVTDPLTAEFFMKNNPGTIKQIFPDAVAVYGAGFSVAKGDPELLQTLNEAIKASINIGLVNRVLKTYDPESKFFLPPAYPYEVRP